MHLPKTEGVGSANGQIVYVTKFLFGLREASNLWFKHFSTPITDIGFRRSATTDCLFIQDGSTPTYIIWYIDDLLIFREESVVRSVKEKLAGLFSVTNLGACVEFLSMKVTFEKGGVTLSQEAMIHMIIANSVMAAAKAVKCPLP